MIRVKLFGSLAQKTNAREIDVEVPDRATGTDLLRVVGERFPLASQLLERASLAVNLEIAPWTTRLNATDEVALLPPASGGAGITVRVGGAISVDEVIAAVSSPAAGGTAVFIGTVRDHADAGSVERLEYTAYDAMAERVLREIAAEAVEKWGLSGVAVQHAVGSLVTGSPTIVVACAAAHRDEAFDACRYVVDELKHRAPIWKKEFGPWGERWIEC
jgi:molybdopterin synthase catalytic subunit/molybdopterin converting factor small subunit